MKPTLIVPCAGKSSRFPNMRPKWMLTHPEGDLMIEKAISGFSLDSFSRVIITIVKEHDEKFESFLCLKQVFDEKIEICVLNEFTKSQSETVYLTIMQMAITGSFVVKDSDNYVEFLMPEWTDFVVGLNLQDNINVPNIPGKSFLILNEQGMITNIVEKQIKSDIISVGVYGFSSATLFMQAFDEIKQSSRSELFLSHVISFLISSKHIPYEFVKASSFNDWGTVHEWRDEMNRYTTYFVDIDGVLMKNSGKFGSFNWEVNDIVLQNNLKCLVDLQKDGAQIVIMSARPKKYVLKALDLFKKFGFEPFTFLSGMNHAKRVIINDFSQTNPYPTAIAVNIPRNGDINEFLNGRNV